LTESKSELWFGDRFSSVFMSLAKSLACGMFFGHRHRYRCQLLASCCDQVDEEEEEAVIYPQSG
jgi:hypothetical protein